MNFKNFIKLFLVSIVSLMFFNVNVEADTFTLNVTDGSCYKLEGLLDSDSSNANSEYKVTTNGEIVYCTNAGLGLPGYGFDNTYGGDGSGCINNASNNAQLNYVFENGYYGANKGATDYLVGNKDTDYYITQWVVWKYTDHSASKWFPKFNWNGENSTYSGAKSGTATMIQKIGKLAQDANDSSKNAMLAVKEGKKVLTISTSDNKLTKSGNYLVSKPISIKGIGLKSAVTLTANGANGVFVTKDINATSGNTTFNNGDTVYVKVPVENIGSSKTITLSASATYSNGTVKIYKYTHNCSSTDLQGMAKWYPGTATASDSLSFTIDKTPVKISKKSITGSSELPGAHLVVKDSNGNVIEEWTSSSTPKEMTLDNGTYTLTENISPLGYVKSSTSVTFVVKDGKVLVNGKEVSSVVITNTPIKVNISKVDITGKKELPGAKLKIVDKDGKTVKDMEGNDLEWISGNKPKEIHIASGEYTLIEVIAPKGYELSDEKITFTVDENGNVLINNNKVDGELIVMKNIPEPDSPPTGNAILYVVTGIGILAIGISTYFILKYYKKKR